MLPPVVTEVTLGGIGESEDTGEVRGYVGGVDPGQAPDPSRRDP